MIETVLFELIDMHGNSFFDQVPLAIATEYELSIQCDYVIWGEDEIRWHLEVCRAIEEATPAPDESDADESEATDSTEANTESEVS